MRMWTRITAGAIGLGLMLMGSVAGAEEQACRLIRGASTPADPSDDVQVCTLKTFIHQGSQKLGNLAGAGQSTYPTWSTTAPTETMFLGGGGAYLANGPGTVADPGNSLHEPRFAGSFTGTLDNMAISLYMQAPVDLALTAPYSMELRITIDGEMAVERVFPEPEFTAPVELVNDRVCRIRFATTNLYETMKLLDLDTSPEAQHAITVQIAAYYYGTDNAVFLYGSTDAPSGIVFNIESGQLGPYSKLDALAELEG
ncbi:MAG: hypothetical protein ACRDHM_09885 [Actinomycetota bacterium]